MALSWEELQDTSDTDPPFCVFYGGGGLGKTTLGCEFPAPLYVRTAESERPPAGVKPKTRGVCETYADVTDQIDWMLEAEHDRKTFLLDALDSMETLITTEACARGGWSDLDEPGFGKGQAKAFSIWLEFIGLLMRLKKAGYYVVLIGHVKAKTVPGVTTDSYPRYMLNLRDDAGAAIVDASDLTGFIHQRVSITKEKAGFHKDNVRTRGEGSGEVQIAVQERPGFIAKNRQDITKPVLPFKRGEGFRELAKWFPAVAEATAIGEK